MIRSRRFSRRVRTSTASMPDSAEFLRRMPKVELHNHVTGAVRLQTVIDLARKNGLPVPAADLYADSEDLAGFLAAHAAVCRVLREREDFARIAYEALEDGVRFGNLRYAELFFNPTIHLGYGVSYPDVVYGLVDGIRRAFAEFGVVGRLIPSINRQDSLGEVSEMLDLVLSCRPDEVTGIGMDHDELADPPSKFSSIYTAAGRAGLRRTAHAGHDGPASFVLTCLDMLGCERIDHGYHVTDDPVAVARVLDAGVPFCVSYTSALSEGWAVNPLVEMVRAGLWLTLGTDDPTMLHTDLGSEYVEFHRGLGVTVEYMREMCVSAVDACWMDDSDKAVMKASFTAEIEALEAALRPPCAADTL